MQAALYHQTGAPDVIRVGDVPAPQAGPGEVVVRVQAASVNHLDIWTRKGALAGFPPALPHVGGCDGCGEIAEAGAGVRHVRPGDRVIISPGLAPPDGSAGIEGIDSLNHKFRVFGFHTWGAFAEYALCDARHVLPVDGTWMPGEWASMPLVFTTAHRMLFSRARVRPGETVLVHACGSGVGIAAIQLAKLAGARVITTSASDEKLARARSELGADLTINYATEPVADRVLEWTAKRGADVVIDTVGPAVWEDSIRALGRGGRLVNAGATSGPQVTMGLRDVYVKQLSIMGSYLGGRYELEEVLRLARSRAIRPVVDRTFPLAETGAAQAHVESRAHFGKVVIHVAD